MDREEIVDYFRKIPQNFNYVLLFQVLPLLIVSSILVKEIDPRLFQKQMIYYVVGALSLVTAAFIPWQRILWWFAPVSYVINLALLLAVKFVGISILGAKRWIHVPGTPFTLQPSEFIKISVILMLAYLIRRYPPPEEGYGLWSFLRLSIVVLVPFFLIAIEPDLGTAMVLLMTGFGIIFLAGIRWRVTIGLLVAAVIVGWGAWEFDIIKPYQKKRIEDFLGKPSYHVRQALIAIGSGGLKGKPKDDATQTQLKFLPISSSDFIFAYLGERFGFWGMLIVIGTYILLIVHLLRISRIYEDDYAVRAVASGLAFLIFIYMGVNIYMIIGMAPVVGVPLPMFSHGGTSFIIFAVLFGILLNLIAFKRYFQYNADARITMLEKDAIERDLRTPVSARRKRPEQEPSSVEAKLAALKKHSRTGL
jgi:rod shape determining protein RodA